MSPQPELERHDRYELEDLFERGAFIRAEAQRVRAMSRAACHSAREQLDKFMSDELAEAIRETCRLVEKRLAEPSAA